MKPFITRVLIFITPIVTLCLAAELLLRNIPNDYKYKRQTLDDNAESIETLILGSSHFYYGIDPEYMGNHTYNAAYVSQTLEYDHALFKKYVKRLKHLKTLILPADYFSLYLSLDKSIESWRVKDYSIYYGTNRGPFLTYEILNSKFNIIQKRIDEYYLKHISSITCTELGWGTVNSYKNKKNIDSTGVIAAKRHTAQNDEAFDQNLRYLNDIVKTANEKKIKVLILTLPAFRTYVQNLDSNQLSRTVLTINNLASTNPNTTYVNLLTDSDFVADDYYDADHLDEFGAKKLSLKLDSIIHTLK